MSDWLGLILACLVMYWMSVHKDLQNEITKGQAIYVGDVGYKCKPEEK